ncbi:hypothetical protein ACVWY5_006525 [Bradyrhizobium sp. USDA 3256]
MRHPAGCFGLSCPANKPVAFNSWWSATSLFSQALSFRTAILIEEIYLLGKMQPGHALPPCYAGGSAIGLSATDAYRQTLGR